MTPTNCVVCGLSAYKNGLCYYHFDMLKKPSGLEKVSEEMWISPKSAPTTHTKCSVCRFGLLTDVEKATGLCYLHIKE